MALGFDFVVFGVSVALLHLSGRTEHHVKNSFALSSRFRWAIQSSQSSCGCSLLPLLVLLPVIRLYHTFGIVLISW